MLNIWDRLKFHFDCSVDVVGDDLSWQIFKVTHFLALLLDFHNLVGKGCLLLIKSLLKSYRKGVHVLGQPELDRSLARFRHILGHAYLYIW